MKQDCRTCKWGEYMDPPRGSGGRRIACKYPVPDPMPLSWTESYASLTGGSVNIIHCDYYHEIEVGTVAECKCWRPKKKASVGLGVVKAPPFTAQEPEQRHECAVCGRRFAWGSEKQLDDGEPILKFCSACCRRKWWREKRGKYHA